VIVLDGERILDFVEKPDPEGGEEQLRKRWHIYDQQEGPGASSKGACILI
jgi:hypothetical protein